MKIRCVSFVRSSSTRACGRLVVDQDPALTPTGFLTVIRRKIVSDRTPIRQHTATRRVNPRAYDQLHKDLSNLTRNTSLLLSQPLYILLSTRSQSLCESTSIYFTVLFLFYFYFVDQVACSQTNPSTSYTPSTNKETTTLSVVRPSYHYSTV